MSPQCNAILKTGARCSKDASSEAGVYYYQQMCKLHKTNASQLEAKKKRKRFPKGLWFFEEEQWTVVSTIMDGDCSLDAVGMAVNHTESKADKDAWTCRAMRETFVRIMKEKARREKERDEEKDRTPDPGGYDSSDSERTVTDVDSSSERSSDSDTGSERSSDVDSRSERTSDSDSRSPGPSDEDTDEDEGDDSDETSRGPGPSGGPRMEDKAYLLANDDVEALCAHFRLFPVIINQKYTPGSEDHWKAPLVLFGWHHLARMIRTVPDLRVVVLYNRQDIVHYELIVKRTEDVDDDDDDGTIVALHSFSDLPEQVRENIWEQVQFQKSGLPGEQPTLDTLESLLFPEGQPE